jgi:aminopeptidase N
MKTRITFFVRIASVFAIASASWAGLVHAQPRFAYEQTPTVLPKTVLPSHYTLALDLDPARSDFSGEVTIALDVREAVPALVLHADQLRLREARLLPAGGAALLLQASAGQPKIAQTWSLARRGGQAIAPGRYELALRYSGRIQKSGEGLFRADHRVNGQPAAMLATQLQAVQGRKLLPSFDEPVFRASFDVTVRTPKGWQVLGNMPLQSVQAEGAHEVHRFERTPAMVSYLLALAVGRFDTLESKAAGVPLRIFTVPGQREKARYAMGVTEQVLPWFNGYFGQPYALPKLDQLAVPGTRTGAMEDWGLISYEESALLFDPQRGSSDTQRRIFRIVAHEIAHQWFGNLVSVASWEEIWLNEAFATWMEGKAADQFHPEWQSTLSARGWLERTMERDATEATRAIRSGAVPEDRVFDVFDGITYSKGGAVLSMLEQWVGEANFQRGMAAYMAERRMKSATAGDLWHHVGAAVDLPVAAVAASWTDQPGFPLIDLRARCEQGRTVVEATQQRFRLLPPKQPDSANDSATWRVPLRLARGSQISTVMLDRPQARFELPGCGSEPVLGNAGGRGFYRMRYETAHAQALARALPALPAVDRNVLLADGYALAQAGAQPLAAHFELLAQLPGVKDAGRAPLYATATRQLLAMDSALHGTPSQAAVRRATLKLLAPELQRLGWQPAPDEDAEVTRVRPLLIEALAELGDAAVIKAAQAKFNAALAAESAVHPSIREAVLKAVARGGRAADVDALWSALRKAERQQEMWALVSALAAQPQAAQIERLLKASLGNSLPPDLALDIVGFVARSPVHAEAAYRFAVQHWRELAAKGGSGVFGARQGLLPDAAQGTSDVQAAARLRADQARLAGPTGRVSAERTAAGIEVRAALRTREAQRLAAALANGSAAP